MQQSIVSAYVEAFDELFPSHLSQDHTWFFLAGIDRIASSVGISNKELGRFLFWGYDEKFPDRKLDSFLEEPHRGPAPTPARLLIADELHRLAWERFGRFVIVIDYVDGDDRYTDSVSVGNYKLKIVGIRKAENDDEKPKRLVEKPVARASAPKAPAPGSYAGVVDKTAVVKASKPVIIRPSETATTPTGMLKKFVDDKQKELSAQVAYIEKLKEQVEAACKVASKIESELVALNAALSALSQTNEVEPVPVAETKDVQLVTLQKGESWADMVEREELSA